jgi:phage gpG-like protein
VADVVVNVRALLDALEKLKEDAVPAARAAAEAMGAVGERAIKLELSRSSHAAGTKTPASAGSPPSLISGRLRGSVRQTRSFSSGSKQWSVWVAPTVVYARIQELGGFAGKGHHAHLPPRPYISPAVAKSNAKLRDAAITAFRQASGLP